jgi:hypothetical protein
MNLVKTLALAVACWVGAWLGWVVLLAITAIASGRGHGAQLTISMAVLFLGALALDIASVVLVKQLAWRALPAGAGRLLLVVAFAVAQLATYGFQGFISLVAFDR